MSGPAEEKWGDQEYKKFRTTDTRLGIWNQILQKVKPVIKYRFSSDSKAIDIAGELGSRYIDNMIHVYQNEYQEIEERIEELEKEKEELEERWETEEVKFRHLDKVI